MANSTSDTKEQNRHFDVIVIGSGMGGMACASALAHFGQKVLVLEQHYVAGGMTHTFKRKKFEWDVGVHALGEMGDNRLPGKLINWLSDGKVKMNAYGHPYETFIFPDGYKFEYPNSKEEFKENLIKDFPLEKEGITEFINLVNQVGKTAKKHFAARLAPLWFEKLTSPLIKREFNKWANKTLKEVLDSLFKDEKLKAVVSGQWGYYGSPPSRASFFIHAITLRHFWEGAYYPEGTSKVLAEHILSPVEQNGGEIKVKTSVESLLMDGKKAIGVKTNKGDYFAPTVVSAIGAIATMEHLIPENRQNDPWVKKISELDQTPCHLCLYLGFEGDIKSVGATESNQWWCETWDFEEGVWDVKKKDLKPPVIYVSFPSLKDPKHEGVSKEGKPLHTGEVVTFVPWEYFEEWKETKVGRRGDSYKEFKKDMEERIIAQMRKNLPELMDLCVYHELSTPLSTMQYCRPPKGAIYGLEPTPKRWNTLELRPETPIKGFYLSGADVGTLGVVGALIGGVLTASKIDKRVVSKMLGK